MKLNAEISLTNDGILLLWSKLVSYYWLTRFTSISHACLTNETRLVGWSEFVFNMRARSWNTASWCYLRHDFAFIHQLFNAPNQVGWMIINSNSKYSFQFNSICCHSKWFTCKISCHIRNVSVTSLNERKCAVWSSYYEQHYQMGAQIG